MSSLSADQLPEGWSDGARGYDRNFAGYTALYADEMLDLLLVGDTTQLLDVAAGTGATSLRAAARGARVIAIDFAPGMVEVAAAALDAGGFDGSIAAVMDGQALDLPDDHVDAAVSMFGLMFFPDPGAGMHELRRVVRPGGRVGTATWDLDGFSMSSLIGAALAVAVPELADVERPAPTWAPLGTPAGLEQLLCGAELRDVQVRRIERRWHFDRPAEFFRDMPSWSSPAKPLFDLLPAERIDAAAEAFATELAAAGGTTGGVGLPMTALIATGIVG
jgi:SAM-dependent methyltransferase